MQPGEITGQRPRYALLDAARGVGMILMFVYHFSWDLSFFRMADFQIFSDPKWIWFAKFIASIFLFVMGIAQVMARRRGLSRRAFLRRFTLIAAAAGAVSLATFVIDPGSYIFFGILHHIAAASLILAVAILLPSPALIGIALVIAAAPWFLSGDLFNADLLHWLGLSTAAPISVDYVPIFPWLSVPLIGVVAGRIMFRGGRVPEFLLWVPADPVSRLVHLIGRHSLLLYLVHQPILFGGVYLFVNFIAGE
ncbi:MAG: heparan-alpha-glucosaminide N-acetyltransferase [Rhodospirillales bacterium]|jgi:uncharacterized membrane protein|nr:hypothetical protein [Rhodospirillaceae bacterium]MDP6430233.1 heparan-alpha-glucosaminide N-acetyltransferase [Rhodospirillales bacterium]MDP6646222.1 heparan-alpha-glucosaminide N-acetyltransferase [Rhodospirillales bacterium]MDP6840140.1 heparan-alpha-glucosaminide N-acetyltransferase [Rhodospirillales bacterium]|tara:strand:+ start:187 stop:939 length:753 start_codon:yes stop_codon:yes gene_type:complete